MAIIIQLGGLRLSPAVLGNKIVGWALFLLLSVGTVFLAWYALCGNRPPVRRAVCGDRNDPHVGAVSILGTRGYQQDRAVFGSAPQDSAQEHIVVVCDGMGGMAEGERASAYCCERFFDLLKKPRKWEDTPGFLYGCARELDREIAAFTDGEGRRIESGTTLAAAVVRAGKLHWVSAGDSRIYLLSDNRFQMLSRDHNYELQLREKVAQGEMTQEEAQREPMKEALISYIGLGREELIDTSVSDLPLETGDVVLVCSDGVTKLVSDKELEQILLAGRALSPEMLARAIVDRSVQNRRKSQDNTTAAVIKI